MFHERAGDEDRSVRGTVTWADALEPAWYHVWFFYAIALIYMLLATQFESIDVSA